MAAPFVNDQLFQLNLFLWMLWSSDVAGIDPILRKEGFSLHAIGPTVTPPIQAAALAHANEIPINKSACPDLLLKQESQLLLVPIECKLSSFGTASSTATQANVLLTAIGRHIAETIGLPSTGAWTSNLIYALNDDASQMLDTLRELTRQLEDAAIDTVASGAISIKVKRNGVYLQCLPCDTSPIAALRYPTPTDVRVLSLDEGDDPRPFYLLPVDPSIDLNDSFGISLLEKRIRIAVMAVFGSRLDNNEFEVSDDDFMREVLEVWDYWKDTKARTGLLKRAVRPYLRQVFSEIRKFGIHVEDRNRRIKFAKITPERAQQVRAYFTSQSFFSGEIKLIENIRQLSFSDLNDDW